MWVIAIAVIVYFAFVFGIIGGSGRDEEKNMDANLAVDRCEAMSDSNTCWVTLLRRQTEMCEENSSYDICKNKMIEVMAGNQGYSK